MKAVKFVSHPAIVVMSFFIILISGEHLGGFYLLYLLLGLPYGAIHSILGAAGVCILLFTKAKYQRKYYSIMEPVLNIVGLGLLVSSICLFFIRDKQNYNQGTFEQLIPLLTIGLFGLISVVFICFNISMAIKVPIDKDMSPNRA